MEALLTPSSVEVQSLPAPIPVAGNQLTVFLESPPLLAAMEADILAASHRVWLETYIFSNDPGATRIADALKQKARQGLNVRLLYDAVGSFLTPDFFFDDLASAGVKIHAYHSLLQSIDRFKFFPLNRRDHRKLLLVDNTIGYFGGMNIVDSVQLETNPTPSISPPSAGWRDVHIRLAGPQQFEIADSFERFWNRVHGIRTPRRPRFRLRLPKPAARFAEPLEYIRFFDSTPRRFSSAARIYNRLFQAAQSRITLAMAYFIPTPRILRALYRARKRRVAVRIILPAQSDVPLARRAAAYLYNRLLRHGIQIYERQQRMLHSKMAVIDDLYTIVGSANLDPRSLHINHEFLAVIRSPAFARRMNAVAEEEIAHSTRVTRQTRRLSRWQKTLNALAWSLRFWL